MLTLPVTYSYIACSPGLQLTAYSKGLWLVLIIQGERIVNSVIIVCLNLMSFNVMLVDFIHKTLSFIPFKTKLLLLFTSSSYMNPCKLHLCNIALYLYMVTECSHRKIGSDS